MKTMKTVPTIVGGVPVDLNPALEFFAALEADACAADTDATKADDTEATNATDATDATDTTEIDDTTLEEMLRSAEPALAKKVCAGVGRIVNHGGIAVTGTMADASIV
jgi:hypothetical protein